MHSPKITIIVPIYNAEKCLSHCLDSILAQDFTDFELLLINDGSTDSSKKICDKYRSQDSRIHVFHKVNGGVSSARNIGIDNASGDWITFCDADDYVNPSWLNVFAENCIGQDLVVQGFVTDRSDIAVGVDYKGNAQDCFWLLHRKFILGYVWVKLFRHDIIGKYHIRFNEDFRFLEDEDFVVRYLSVIRNVACVKKGGYVYNLPPEFAKKYSGIDNFYWSCSMICSIQQLIRTKRPVDFYLNAITNSLFYSFEAKKDDRCEKLKNYQLTVGRYVIYSQINIFSKLVLLIIRCPKIASWILDIKLQLKKHASLSKR